MTDHKVEIGVHGMHCASCANNVERSLKKVSGVTDVKVNLLAKKAYVECDKNVCKEDLENAVKKVGYKVISFKFDEYKEHMLHEGHGHGGLDDSEVLVWKKKMLGSLLFTIPIFILMILMEFKIVDLNEIVLTLIFLLLAFPVIFIFGFHTVKLGLRGLVTFYFNMDSLIVFGTTLAYLTGILSFFIVINDYSASGAMIMTIFIIGKYVEARARGKSVKEIKSLLELGAKTAKILVNGKEREISIEEIKVGDIMVIRPGERIPTDGIVVKGESSVDESMISGESMPVDKLKGSKVIGATINQDGILYVKTDKIGKDTFLAHIINIVEKTQSQKIPIQALADKITYFFVPTILTLAVLTFVFWFLKTSLLSESIANAISVLVIACPCALGLAVPIVITVSSGLGAKKGILIRNGEAIQTIKQAKTIVFDKTGTITLGKPRVINIVTNFNQSYLLEVAASLERNSEHPIARAIVDKARLKKYKEVTAFKIIRGKGVEGIISKKRVIIGNRLLMLEKKVNFEEYDSSIREFESGGKTVMIVAENNKALGVIAVADSVKEDSMEVISKLNINGYKTIMITGDNETTSRAIAKEVGVKEVIANVLPEDKAKKIKDLQEKGEIVIFIGDGVNDAPAIKQANVGIAIGTGTDVAIEAGDIVLVSGNLKEVLHSITLSKKTFSKIKQNLFWAFAYNVIAIPIAVMGLLNPIIAETAMAISSLTVVFNANLLRNTRI